MQSSHTPRLRAGRSTTVIENLESRRLLASINVADFGAVPNDGQDDSAAIRAALRASRAGDVLNFAPGVYDIHSTIEMRSNRELKGWGEAVLKRHGEGFVLRNDRFNYNITITDLTFEGGGINIAPDSTGEHILVRGNTFRDIGGSWPYGEAIYAPSGLRDSKITRSLFKNLEDNGVYGFTTFDRVEISHNHFDNVWEGIHLAYDNGGSDLKVIYNTGTNWTRMPVELQGRNARNTLVEGNVFRGWKNPYHGSFALSIMNYGEGTVIRNNIVEGPHEAPVGIEVGGRNGIVENNIVIGFREGLHLVGSSGTHVRNNQFYGQKMMGIWRTGIDEAYDVRIYDNLIKDSNWGFLFSGGKSDGTVVENNTVINADKGIVGDAPGVHIGHNVFQNVNTIR